MKVRHLVLGLALIGAGTAVSLAADAAAPAADAAATTQAAPATPAAPADASAPATPAAPATGETAAAAQPDPNEKICKKDEMTGSRLRGQVCKTRKEWEEEAKSGGGDF